MLFLDKVMYKWEPGFVLWILNICILFTGCSTLTSKVEIVPFKCWFYSISRQGHFVVIWDSTSYHPLSVRLTSIQFGRYIRPWLISNIWISWNSFPLNVNLQLLHTKNKSLLRQCFLLFAHFDISVSCLLIALCYLPTWQFSTYATQCSYFLFFLVYFISAIVCMHIYFIQGEKNNKASISSQDMINSRFK